MQMKFTKQSREEGKSGNKGSKYFVSEVPHNKTSSSLLSLTYQQDCT